MGAMSQEEINVDLFNEVKRLKSENIKNKKLIDEWIKAYNNHINTEEEKEFIHVFRRVLVEHHMDSKLKQSDK